MVNAQREQHDLLYHDKFWMCQTTGETDLEISFLLYERWYATDTYERWSLILYTIDCVTVSVVPCPSLVCFQFMNKTTIEVYSRSRASVFSNSTKTYVFILRPHNSSLSKSHLVNAQGPQQRQRYISIDGWIWGVSWLKWNITGMGITKAARIPRLDICMFIVE